VLRLFSGILLAVVVQAAEPQRLHLTDFGGPPTEEEVRGLLASICPRGIVADPEFQGFSGCRTCPEFTSARDWTNWSVAAIYYGHFSDPSAEEAAVAILGCEPHSMKWGGTALFRRDGEKWKLKWYHGRLIIKDCIMVRGRDQRDLLVCADRDGGQGTMWRTLSVMDLGKTKRFREHELLTLTDNMLTCGIWGNYEGIVPIQKAVFTEVAFDQDRAVLEAKVEYGWRHMTLEGAKKCEDANNGKRHMPPWLQPAAKIYDLLFDFDGEKFQIRPESRKAEATVKTDMPARYAPKDP
jgi:hypothetical protein